VHLDTEEADLSVTLEALAARISDADATTEKP
jgi:hypothetical protein